MPLFTRNELEELDIVCNLFSVMFLPWSSVHYRRNERSEQLAIAEDSFSCFHTHLHTVSPHLTACRTVLHSRIYIQRSKDRVEW